MLSIIAILSSSVLMISASFLIAMTFAFLTRLFKTLREAITKPNKRNPVKSPTVPLVNMTRSKLVALV